jgi:hypothetical protein
MMKWSHLALPSLALLAAAVAFTGCSPTATPPNPAPAPNPGPAAGLKSIMNQIGKPKSLSLWSKIHSELNSDAPPWDELKPQTEKLSNLAANVDNYDPPKAKESWHNDATNFAKLAADLNAAVQAKDKDNAGKVNIKMSSACDECHRAHGGPLGVGD